MQTVSVLHNRDFRLLILAKFLGSFAGQMQAVAVGWQVYALKHDPFYLGLIGLAEAVPSIGIALFAGHLADRGNPRRIYFWASGMGLVGSLGLWAISIDPFQMPESARIAAIFAVIFGTGLGRGFLEPSHFKLVSGALPREQLKLAAPWNSSAWQLATIGGPALGGILYATLGVQRTYAAVVWLVLGSLLCCAQLGLSTIAPRIAEGARLRQSLESGVRFVFGKPILLGAISLDMFAVLFGGATSILPMYVDQVLHQGPVALGILRAAPSVGAMILAAYLLHRPVSRRAGPALLLSVGGFGACMIGFAFSRSLALSVGLLALSGALDNISVLIRYTLLQLSAPDEMRGRISAVNNIFLGSSNEIGEFESGVAATLMGLVPSIAFGGTMTLVVVALTAWLVPALRRLDLGELEALPAPLESALPSPAS